MISRIKSVFADVVSRPRTGPGAGGAPSQPAALMGLATATAVGRGLQAAIRGNVFMPGQAGFNTASHVFNPRFDHVLPTAVARPIDARDVQAAVRFTVARGYRRALVPVATATLATPLSPTASSWTYAV